MLVRARFTGITGITLEVPVDVSGAVAEAEVLAAAVRNGVVYMQRRKKPTGPRKPVWHVGSQVKQG